MLPLVIIIFTLSIILKSNWFTIQMNDMIARPTCVMIIWTQANEWYNFMALFLAEFIAKPCLWYMSSIFSIAATKTLLWLKHILSATCVIIVYLRILAMVVDRKEPNFQTLYLLPEYIASQTLFTKTPWVQFLSKFHGYNNQVIMEFSMTFDGKLLKINNRMSYYFGNFEDLIAWGHAMILDWGNVRPQFLLQFFLSLSILMPISIPSWSSLRPMNLLSLWFHSKLHP